MGLFSSSSSSSSSSASTSSPPPAQQALPTRSSRQACWDHRDAYFSCLTANSILVPPGTDTSDGRGPPKTANETTAARDEDPCKDKRNGYEANCAKSWVDYFNKRRLLEERQRLLYEKSGQRQL